MWRSEDISQELALSFYHIDPRHFIEVISNDLCSLRLTGPVGVSSKTGGNKGLQSICLVSRWYFFPVFSMFFFIIPFSLFISSTLVHGLLYPVVKIPCYLAFLGMSYKEMCLGVMLRSNRYLMYV